jgi:Ca2+-binding EF-hand superfamily protein
LNSFFFNIILCLCRVLDSGTVDFEEFVYMMSTFGKLSNQNEVVDELKDIFKIFDKNQDGYIDKMELWDVLIRLGENITQEEAFDMIKEADTDGDNKVSFAGKSH